MLQTSCAFWLRSHPKWRSNYAPSPMNWKQKRDDLSDNGVPQPTDPYRARRAAPGKQAQITLLSHYRSCRHPGYAYIITVLMIHGFRSMANVVTINRPDVVALIEEAAKRLTGGNKTEAVALALRRLLERDARAGSLFGAHPGSVR